MRKLISKILVVTMILSLFVSFGTNAAHWAQDAIDYVTENGYWIAPGEIEPDRPATRAETASLFARILISKIPAYNGAYEDVTYDNMYGGDITAVSLMELMKGYDGKFRPDDTVTREELAVILNRAADMISDNYPEAVYNEAFLKDFSQVSEWAVQDVKDAMAYVLMKGKQGKRFDPQGTTTVAEVATVVKTLADLSDQEKVTVTASERFLNSSDKIATDFDVIQSAGMGTQCGLAGFGMMVRFDGTPGDIYIARTPSSAAADSFNTNPCTVVRVVGPDGRVIIRANMYYKTQGTMEKIINIPNGEPGIYRIEFTTGKNKDLVTIGVKNPASWGIYGESEFKFSDTTPTTSYFYVPKKFAVTSIGLGGGNATAAVYSQDGFTKVAETDVSTADNTSARKRMDVTSLKPDTVYMLKLPENFRGSFGMIGGSKVLCPTPEMAADLKGNYVYVEDEYGGLQVAGPLQAKARERMVEIYNELGGNFDIEVQKPELPHMQNNPLDNPMGEAQLYSAYFGSVTGVKPALKKQVLDPSNPWFGCTATTARIEGTEAWPDKDWQVGYYQGGGMRSVKNFTGALTINAETNAYYANPILQKRVELGWLAWIVQMTESGTYYYGNVAGGGCNYYYHTYENFQYGEQGMPYNYFYSRNFLSPKTKAICDEGM
ncbi:MAG: S-layer homology domain-containing protein [Monoglobales bacterium]